MIEKNKLNIKNNIDPFFYSFLNYPLFGISCIIVISILFRMYYFVPEIPLTLDALEYFFYAMDTSILGHLPTNYSLDNNGWPAFLSMFFSFFNFEEGISYIQLQRILSIIISASTIIPIYLLCRKFVGKPESLVASSIFAFEPRIIQNSLLGLTEPLYLLLCSISLLLFLSNSKKLVYSSFAIVSLATLVRSEALFLFIVLSIIFFVRFRNDKFVIPKYLPALVIFVLLLLPMSLYRIETIGNDGIFFRVTEGIERTQTGITQGIFTGFENYFKFLGWDLIPLFIIFVPIGFFLILKNINYQKLTIIISTIVMSLPALYAYSVPALDTRFLFILYPMFCIFSALTIKKFIDKFLIKNLILIAILCILFLSSYLFLEYKVLDTKHEREAFNVAKYLVQSSNVFNNYYPESRYLESVEIFENWELVKPYFLDDREKGVSIRSSIPHKFAAISTNDFDTLEDFIHKNKEKGLTVIVTDNENNRSKFILDAYNNEEKYPYLIKELDTSDIEYSYHVKIFRIDYDKFSEQHR